NQQIRAFHASKSAEETEAKRSALAANGEIQPPDSITSRERLSEDGYPVRRHAVRDEHIQVEVGAGDVMRGSLNKLVPRALGVGQQAGEGGSHHPWSLRQRSPRKRATTSDAGDQPRPTASLQDAGGAPVRA